MDDKLEQRFKAAKAYRNKQASMFGAGMNMMRQGFGAAARGLGRGMGAAGRMIGQGAGIAARNPGRVTAATTAGVGAGLLGPGGYGADALGSMGIIDDPVKQYGSYAAKHEQMRTNYYDKTYAPAQAAYSAALAAGTATQDDYNKVQELANRLQTGEYGGGWFSPDAKTVQQRAMAASQRMQQPYKPNFLRRMLGGFGSQQEYNNYANQVIGSYGAKAPPGFGSRPAGVGPLLPSAPLLHRSTGELFTQPTPSDPRQLALQNLYSGRDQLPSAWQ